MIRNAPPVPVALLWHPPAEQVLVVVTPFSVIVSGLSNIGFTQYWKYANASLCPATPAGSPGSLIEVPPQAASAMIAALAAAKIPRMDRPTFFLTECSRS
jgi:hypothetical protein